MEMARKKWRVIGDGCDGCDGLLDVVVRSQDVDVLGSLLGLERLLVDEGEEGVHV